MRTMDCSDDGRQVVERRCTVFGAVEHGDQRSATSVGDADGRWADVVGHAARRGGREAARPGVVDQACEEGSPCHAVGAGDIDSERALLRPDRSDLAKSVAHLAAPARSLGRRPVGASEQDVDRFDTVADQPVEIEEPSSGFEPHVDQGVARLGRSPRPPRCGRWSPRWRRRGATRSVRPAARPRPHAPSRRRHHRNAQRAAPRWDRSRRSGGDVPRRSHAHG